MTPSSRCDVTCECDREDIVCLSIVSIARAHSKFKIGYLPPGLQVARTSEPHVFPFHFSLL